MRAHLDRCPTSAGPAKSGLIHQSKLFDTFYSSIVYPPRLERPAEWKVGEGAFSLPRTPHGSPAVRRGMSTGRIGRRTDRHEKVPISGLKRGSWSRRFQIETSCVFASARQTKRPDVIAMADVTGLGGRLECAMPTPSQIARLELIPAPSCSNPNISAQRLHIGDRGFYAIDHL
jgi:hypothetical protein